VSALLEANPKINPGKAMPGSSGGATPLTIASDRNHARMVERLLADPRVNPNAHTKVGGGTALFVACQEGNTAVVKALLKDGRVNVNKACADGRTPLLVAAFRGHDVEV